MFSGENRFKPNCYKPYKYCNRYRHYNNYSLYPSLYSPSYPYLYNNSYNHNYNHSYNSPYNHSDNRLNYDRYNDYDYDY